MMEKSTRDSITWYFPPKNPPADITPPFPKDLKDYFKPLEQNKAGPVASIHNGNPEILPGDDSHILSPEISEKYACDEPDESQIATVNLAAKLNYAENTPKRKKDLTDDEADPLIKKGKFDQLDEKESIKEPVNSTPVRRHKTKAFYKQVLPPQAEDLTAKNNSVYQNCSKGIKKYFASKAAGGAKSPRRIANDFFHDTGRNSSTPPKKRRCNHIESFDPAPPRVTRHSRKQDGESENLRPLRTSPRAKAPKLNPKPLKTKPKAKLSLKQRPTLVVEEEKPEKYSLRTRNTPEKVEEKVSGEVRRSSRLTAPKEMPALEKEPATSKSEDDGSKVLESFYVAEVVDGDALGSPIRLKFTRVKDKGFQSSSFDFVPEETVKPVQPMERVHKKKHSKKKHKRHKNLKFQQYRSIVKRAIDKPQGAALRQASPHTESGGRRSLRQSSILNRKAVEGAQKADQLKKKRWEQQRLFTPVKKSAKKLEDEATEEELAPRRSTRNASVTPEKKAELPQPTKKQEPEAKKAELPQPTKKQEPEAKKEELPQPAKKQEPEAKKDKLPQPAKIQEPETKEVVNDTVGKRFLRNRTSKSTAKVVSETKPPIKVVKKKKVGPKSDKNMIENSAVESTRPVRKAKLAARLKNRVVEQDSMSDLWLSQPKITRRSIRGVVVEDDAIVIDDEKSDDGSSKKSGRNTKKTTSGKAISVETNKCSVKLAPLFCKGKKKPEEPLKREITENERQFLMTTASDFHKVQSQPKMAIEKAPSMTENFIEVCHTQQREQDHPLWNLKMVNLNLKPKLDVSNTKLECGKFFCTDLTSIPPLQSKKVYKSPKLLNEDSSKVIDSIAKQVPIFPVQKTYDRFRKCKGENVDALWTKKYRPSCGKEIIGNSASLSTLSKWLQRWKVEAEKIDNAKTKSNECDSDSDFEVDTKKKSSSAKADFDDDEDEDMICNTMLLTGPHGVGKTAAVYALAKELGFKVFEVNASSKRAGKQITSQLQEVTQSMQVSKAKEDSSNVISTFFKKDNDETSQPNNKNGASLTVSATALLLFEDIDLVFDEDEGFYGAVSNFMAASKRPVILTSNDPSFSISNKLKEDFEELEFVRPPCDSISQHLQLLCLSEDVIVKENDVKTLVRYNQCDIRSSMLALQYGSLSGGWDLQSLTDNNKSNCLQSVCAVQTINTIAHFNAMTPKEQGTIISQYSKCQFDIIDGNYIRLLSLPKCKSTRLFQTPSTTATSTLVNPENIVKRKSRANIMSSCLDSLSNFLDNNSACDSILETRTNCELERRLSCIAPGRCVDEISDDVVRGYDSISRDISSEIGVLNSRCANRCFLNVGRDLKDQCDTVINDAREFHLPTAKLSEELQLESLSDKEQRYAKEVRDMRDAVGTSGALPLSFYFNNAAKAVDYMPILRSICSSEMCRSESCKKRPGRFLHYLDSISIELSPSSKTSMTKYFK